MPETSKTISQLIERQPLCAYVLHRRGIAFNHMRHLSLSEAGKLTGNSPQALAREIRSVRPPSPHDLPKLNDKPLGHIVAYLGQSHHEYAKKRLPFVEFLLNGLGEQTPLFFELGLKMKRFRTEFLKHMKEEEQVFFPHLCRLQHIANNLNQTPLPDLFMFLNMHTLRNFAEDHEPVEDGFDLLKMEAEALLGHFGCNCICTTVLRAELNALQTDLHLHAQLEDHLLLPKAMHLEHKLRKKLRRRSRFN